MMVWMQRCWHWISYTFFGDESQTRVLECRSSVLDTTEVVNCAPTLEIRGPGPAPSLSRAEKRRAVRFPCDQEVRCLPDGNAAAAFRGRLRNLSVVGLGLVSPEQIARNTILLVEIEEPLEVDPRVLAVRVVHVRPMPILGWFLGCEFARQLSDADVRELV